MQVKTFLFKNKINSAQLGFSLFCPEWKRPRFKIAVTRRRYPWSFIRSRVIFFFFFAKRGIETSRRDTFALKDRYRRASASSITFTQFLHEMFSFRKNTETPCQPQASSSRSFGFARCVLLTLVSMTTIVVWPTTLAENFTWVSSRSEKNWTS